jgi:hypothetical protein
VEKEIPDIGVCKTRVIRSSLDPPSSAEVVAPVVAPRSLDPRKGAIQANRLDPVFQLEKPPIGPVMDGFGRIDDEAFEPGAGGEREEIGP